MSPYMLGDAAKLVSSSDPPIYDLYGVANHYGNTYNGHYTAVVKPSGGLANDKGEPGTGTCRFIWVAFVTNAYPAQIWGVGVSIYGSNKSTLQI